MQAVGDANYFNHELDRADTVLYVGKRGGNEIYEQYPVKNFLIMGEQLLLDFKEQKVKPALKRVVAQEEGQDLVRQFESLCGLVEKVKKLAETFEQRINAYDSKNDDPNGAKLVKSKEDAVRIIRAMKNCVVAITANYLTSGWPTSTTLIDRINTLKGNCGIK
jgi:hypothetical protein